MVAWLLACSIVAGSPSDAPERLRNLGYHVGAEKAGYGTLSSDAGKTWFFGFRQGDHLQGIQLNCRWQLTKFFPPRQFKTWLKDRAPQQAAYDSSLNRTAWLTLYVPVEPGMKAQIDRFLSIGKEFERTFGPSLHPKAISPTERLKTPKIDDRVKVDSVNATDMQVLGDQWGYRWKGSFGASSGGWIVPYGIHGRLYAVRELWSNDNRGPGFGLSVQIPKSCQPATDPPGVSFSDSPQPGLVSAYTEFPFRRRHPVTVGEIHAFVASFADQMDKLTVGQDKSR